MEWILYEQKEQIAVLTINRPAALNALSGALLEELDAVIDEVDISQVRCLLVTGAGDKAFVAGADIGEMSGLSREAAKKWSERGNRIFRKLEVLPIPVIAAVNGYALGGGCELAMACDFRIASDKAVFGQPETGLGVPPGFGGTQRLARLVGDGMARELIYTGGRIDAQEALRIGLVNHVYPAESLMEEALRIAGAIARGAPMAVRAAKKAIDQGLQGDIDRGLAIEADAFGSCFESQDQQEAMKAFIEKRKPAPFQNC